MLARCLLLRVLGAAVAVALAGAGPAAAATLRVNTTQDETVANGRCSLREAIQAVDSPGATNGDCGSAAAGPNTIVLGPRSYRLHGAGELMVRHTVTKLTITGAGAKRTLIDAAGVHDRVFEIAAGTTVTIRDLTITGGHARDGVAGVSSATPGIDGGNGQPGEGGGAILNFGSLTLLDAAITNSTAGRGGNGGSAFKEIDNAGGVGGTGGAGGNGGAILNEGSLTLDETTIADNWAGTGGNGGTGAAGNPDGGSGGWGGFGGSGGGIANDGTLLTIIASTIKGKSPEREAPVGGWRHQR